MSQNETFEAIYNVVRLIPAGKVMTYGQIALEARVNARTVGWALANVPDETIP
jgi:methylated-DNA-protein-cysteine methyltransferase related protein